ADCVVGWTKHRGGPNPRPRPEFHAVRFPFRTDCRNPFVLHDFDWALCLLAKNETSSQRTRLGDARFGATIMEGIYAHGQSNHHWAFRCYHRRLDWRRLPNFVTAASRTLPGGIR